MNTKKTLMAAVLAAIAVTPALADKGGHGKHRDDDRDRVTRMERHHHRGDRVALVDPATGHACPPGLAKKNPPCVPPGQAKKGVVVGQALPPGAVFVVPPRVLSTLPPPPAGHRYAVVNNQVVLVSNSNTVVDIILRNMLG